MDLKMQMYNRAYKESSKTSRGQLTDATIAQHSWMLALADNINTVYDGGKKFQRGHGKVDPAAAVDTVAMYVLDQSLCKYIPGRFHRRFENACLQTTPVQFQAMHERIRDHRHKQYWDKCIVYYK